MLTTSKSKLITEEHAVIVTSLRRSIVNNSIELLSDITLDVLRDEFVRKKNSSLLYKPMEIFRINIMTEEMCRPRIK